MSIKKIDEKMENFNRKLVSVSEKKSEIKNSVE